MTYADKNYYGQARQNWQRLPIFIFLKESVNVNFSTLSASVFSAHYKNFHIYNVLKPDCGDLDTWKVYTANASQMLKYVNGYKMTRHPENPILYLSNNKECANLVEFSLSPIYTIGTDLYLIEKFIVTVEMSDEPLISVTDEMMQYIENSIHYIINPEALDTYKDQTALDEVPANELLTISGNVLTVKGTAEGAMAAVFSADGRQVMSFSGSTADISALPSGLYILRATTPDGKIITAKFEK